jgi:hypothetical protein
MDPGPLSPSSLSLDDLTLHTRPSLARLALNNFSVEALPVLPAAANGRRSLDELVQRPMGEDQPDVAIVHAVEKNDSLMSISLAYGTSVRPLRCLFARL